MIFIAAFCAYGTVRSLFAGLPTWWLWLLATVGHLGGLLLARATAAKLGAVSMPRAPASQRRHLRVLVLVASGVAAVYAAQLVAGSAAEHDSAVAAAGAVIPLVAALVAFVAAGWAAVWASNEAPVRPEDQREE